MSRSQVVALHTEASPLLATSPYHAFASAPPCALRKPKHWPGDEGSPSTVRLLWDDEALYVSWELHGDPVPPVQLKEDPMLEALTIRRFQVVHGFEFEDVLWVRNGDGILTTLPTEQRSLLFDERVECFLWQPISVAGADIGAVGEDELYFAFEINYGCKVLSNRAHFGGRFGFDWDSSQAFRVWSENISVGPEGDAALKPLSCRVVVGEFRWDVLRIDKSKEIRIGLHRAQHPQDVWEAALERRYPRGSFLCSRQIFECQGLANLAISYTTIGRMSSRTAHVGKRGVGRCRLRRCCFQD
eukprot:symbB.v1.2.012751.t1/scaffold886.1/size155167/7